MDQKLLVFFLCFLFHFAKSAKFWQITDIHYDKFYVNKGQEGHYCHRGQTDDGKAGRFGDYKCEAGLELLISAIDEMALIEPDPDFILWTGDSSPHWKHDDSPDWSYVYQAEKFIGEQIKLRFPNTSVVPVLGNHDTYLPDNFTANDPGTKPENYTSFQYSDFIKFSGWDSLMDRNEKVDFEFCGFYKRFYEHLNVEVIALNTNLYYRTEIVQLDPCGQLEWLKVNLKKAENEGRKVIVTGHVPPGFFERHYIGPFFTNLGGSPVNQIFTEILLNYSHIIVANVFGHTHTDTFRIITQNKKAKSVAFMAPSVTPLVGFGTGTNPGIRLFHYEKGASHLKDYDQYYVNLFEANVIKKLEWSLLYSFVELHDVPDLSPSSLLQIYESIWTDAELFERLYLFNTLLHFNHDCTGDCARNFKCAMGNVLLDDMQRCINQGDSMARLGHTKEQQSWKPEIYISLLFLLVGLGIFYRCYLLPNLDRGDYEDLDKVNQGNDFLVDMNYVFPARPRRTV